MYSTGHNEQSVHDSEHESVHDSECVHDSEHDSVHDSEGVHLLYSTGHK